MEHPISNIPAHNLHPDRERYAKRHSLQSRSALGCAVAAGLLVTLGPPPAAGQGDRTADVSAAAGLVEDSRLDPSAMRVATPCERGPGWLTVTLWPAAEDGTQTVEATAARVIDGSKWRIRVGWSDSGQEHKFRRTAREGMWELTTRVGARESEEQSLEVWADGRSGSCFVGIYQVSSSTTHGFGICGSGLHGLSVRRSDESTVSAFAFVLAVAPDRTRWHVNLAAKGEDERQAVGFNDYSNKWAELTSRVELVGPPVDPRFSLTAESRKTGKKCRIRLNPAVLTVSAEERPLVPQTFLQPARTLKRPTDT